MRGPLNTKTVWRNVLKMTHGCFATTRLFVSVYSGYFVQGTEEDIQLKKPVQLARRKYLPGSFNPGFPQQLSSPREGFPIVLKAKDTADLKDRSIEFWSECFREQIQLLYRDFSSGEGPPVAVLLRGLPIRSTKDFSQFIKGLGYEFFSYEGGGGAGRERIAEFAVTGASEPKEFTLELHNEMSYSIEYPTKIAITCLKKSVSGGETAICNGRELTANLDPALVEKFEKKGVRYLRYLHDKRKATYISWQETLSTENHAEAERFLRRKGYSFKWDGENLIYWNDLSPTITHPLTGEKLWFSQVCVCHCSFYKEMPLYEGLNLPDDKYPNHTVHVDGDAIDLQEISLIRSTGWKTAVGVSLEESDVLFLDNLSVLHSRLSFAGERVVRTSLLK